MPRANTDAPVPPTARSDYREAPPRAELHDLIACRWQQQIRADHTQRVVPDGCIDLIWLAGRQLIVAGPATGAVLAPLPAGTVTLGVRFAPGAGAALAGIPLSELRDRNVALSELWGADAAERLADRLAEMGEMGALGAVDAQLDLLEQAVLARRAEAASADRLVVAAAAIAHERTRVGELSDALGVSERQLLRRFRAAVGYGPKTLARVLRFQRFLTAAWAEPEPMRSEHSDRRTDGDAGTLGLARIALDVGYADQAHLSRECRRLAGVSPRRLLAGG
ncbi:DUF6597 domain-containing transcriptional factor [Conexibacter sp. CPCC 206217]|uniref:DUF6597 domain-containing transcriptional factor n=1 Tax=Conexibacter sp. CPCC 206217 TaxID=3064574 RepID=UPI00271CE65D|nr:DUF6597 domain-containing transcriptional factor [Conexibacter sp. CPCC 206217]MDO8214057.1 hypothetical protein [Conexibacter sp. CPCC 206217]